MTCPQGQTSRQPDLPAAWHALLEIDGADPGALADPAFAEQTLRRACLLAGATVLHGYFHKFGGAGGVTGFLALSESHASIHTWPEFGRGLRRRFHVRRRRRPRRLRCHRLRLQGALRRMPDGHGPPPRTLLRRIAYGSLRDGRVSSCLPVFPPPGRSVLHSKPLAPAFAL